MRIASISTIVIASVLVGCAAVDATLYPRGHHINLTAGRLRDTNILLNIARASYLEPLDFFAVAKYTGGGTLGTNPSLTRVFPALTTTIMGNVQVQGTNSIDFNTLENAAFYGQFMNPVSAQEVHLLLSSGIPRQILLHVILDSIKINFVGGDSYQFKNDPEDDRWTFANGQVQQMSPECVKHAELKPGRRIEPVPGQINPIPPLAGYENSFTRQFSTSTWGGIDEDVWGLKSERHQDDCNYQKFLTLLGEAFGYGVTTEIVSKDAASGEAKPKQATPPQAQLCLDPSLGLSWLGYYVSPKYLLCGSGTKRTGGEFPVKGGPVPIKTPLKIKSFEPVFRSPYGAFRYLGQLIAADAIDRVKIDAGLGVLAHKPLFKNLQQPHRGDASILIVDGDPPCFASLNYKGRRYCVPTHAENTKDVFTLLNSLVALSIDQQALPVTQSVILAR